MTRLTGLNAVLLSAALLLGALVLSLLDGAGREPPELALTPPAQAAPAAAPVQSSPVVPLDSLAPAWQRPLFSTDRSADQSVAAVQSGADIGGILLTGVVVDGPQRFAFFKLPDGRVLVAREGSSLGSDWVVGRIAARQVELSRQGTRQVLQLLTPRLPLAAPHPPSGKP
jgi:general secretion pathway protein N